MRRRKLLKRLSEGQLKNVAFGDMINMIEEFGFRLDRLSGSHHILIHPDSSGYPGTGQSSGS